jgi:hypothetical protein
MQPDEEQVVPNTNPIDKVRCGYVVSVDDDGQINFNIFGSKPGMVEVLGLQAVAESKIRTLAGVKLDTLESRILVLIQDLIKLTHKDYSPLV